MPEHDDIPGSVVFDPLGPLTSAAVDLVARALADLGIEEAAPVHTAPPEGKGDLAFPCFVYSGPLKGSPPDIARDVRARAMEMELETGSPGGVVAGPAPEIFDMENDGPFINFTFKDGALAMALAITVAGMGELYGRGPSRGIKVTVEHTSANPNGPFHVGRSRNPMVGDTLARVMRADGYDVETQYWVNDMGKQLAILAWGVRNLRSDQVPAPVDERYAGKADHVLVGHYQKANELMEADPRVEAGISEILRRNEGGDRAEIESVKEVCQRVLGGMVQSLDRLGVDIDTFVWESMSVLDGSVEEVTEGLKALPQAEMEDGSHFIDMAPFGISGKNTRWAFTRSDGTSLYTTRDVAYHRWKLERCDMAINVLGEDHKLQSRQLGVALELLGTPRERLPRPLFLSFVSLPEGKMSTRRGRVVYLDQLLDEAVERALELVKQKRPELTAEQCSSIAEAVGVGAVRYNIVRIQNEKKMVFQWEDALNFEGQSAPFIQYAHARACSILRKAGRPVESPALLAVERPEELADRLRLLVHPSERDLVRRIARLPSIIREASAGSKVHKVALYAHELASSFNMFYRDCPVLSAKDVPLRDARTTLVSLAAGAMRNTLGTLGIPAPDTM